MVDFDKLINEKCIKLFGEEAVYKDSSLVDHNVDVSFESDFEQAFLGDDGTGITTYTPTCFVRVVDLGFEPQQKDFITIKGIKYYISEVRKHIPGSRQLMLREDK